MEGELVFSGVGLGFSWLALPGLWCLICERWVIWTETEWYSIVPRRSCHVMLMREEPLICHSNRRPHNVCHVASNVPSYLPICPNPQRLPVMCCYLDVWDSVSELETMVGRSRRVEGKVEWLSVGKGWDFSCVPPHEPDEGWCVPVRDEVGIGLRAWGVCRYAEYGATGRVLGF